MGLGIPLLLAVEIIILVVVIAAVQRSQNKWRDRSDGSDIMPYLVLALAVGVAGFALADLVATAFPGERLVFDPAEDLATSLSALVVSLPFVVYFWRRQAVRRESHPDATGWALYLSAIDLVFMTAFIVTSVLFINGLLTEEPATAWARAVVFGAIVVFHELSARATPPISDAGELRRVIGAALSLIAAAVGLTGTITAVLAGAYEAVAGGAPLDPGFSPWVAMAIVGVPIWWYRWLLPWNARPGVPRLSWSVLVSVVALSTAVGGATAILVQVAEYLVTATVPAGEHFEPLTVTLSLVLVGLPIWAIHRVTLREVGGSPRAVYRYAMAALGSVASVSMAIALTVAVFDRTLIVGASASDIVTLTVVLVVGLVVWLVFERRASTDDGSDPSWPDNLYTLGVGVLFGLVAAGALIAALLVLLRRLLGSPGPESLVQPTTTLLYTGLAGWYLLAAYFRDRGTRREDAVVVRPFEVTLVCSHPGMVAAKFPEQARLRVLYRGDDLGVIDEQKADEIVAAVDNQPSLVWVDEDGFEVAPMRVSH